MFSEKNCQYAMVVKQFVQILNGVWSMLCFFQKKCQYATTEINQAAKTCGNALDLSRRALQFCKVGLIAQNRSINLRFKVFHFFFMKSSTAEFKSRNPFV